MDESEVRTQYNKLRFAATRSVKYHDYRQRHFKILFDGTVFLSVSLGILTMYMVAYGDRDTAVYLQLAPAFIVSLLNALLMVFRFSDKHSLHFELRKRFQELEAYLKTVKIEGKISQESVSKGTTMRLDIEKDEPNALRILDLRCHNETCVSMGYNESQHYKIGWIQSLLARYFDFGKIPTTKGLPSKSN